MKTTGSRQGPVGDMKNENIAGLSVFSILRIRNKQTQKMNQSRRFAYSLQNQCHTPAVRLRQLRRYFYHCYYSDDENDENDENDDGYNASSSYYYYYCYYYYCYYYDYYYYYHYHYHYYYY